jgi:hypothetical protein
MAGCTVYQNTHKYRHFLDYTIENILGHEVEKKKYHISPTHVYEGEDRLGCVEKENCDRKEHVYTL